MRVLTTSGRMVTVGHSTAGMPIHSLLPTTSGRGSVKLLDGEGGTRRTTYAVIARSNPWVMGAINERAGLASRVPIHVFRPDPGGREGYRERARAGDNGTGADLAALIATPEPRLSGRRFRRRKVGDILTHGNALAEVLTERGVIVGLRWQPWVDVTPVLSDDGLRVEAFKVPVTRDTTGLGLRRISETRVVDVADALHFTIGDDTEQPLGVSPLASLHNTHALHDAAWRFAKAYLDQGMFPSGIVELDPKATLAQAQITRELIEELHTGVDRAGKPGVLGFGQWKQITATPDGAKLVELAKASREEVATAYRMPWLGNQGEMNRATAEVARKAFIRDVVGEDVSVLETELNAQLVDPHARWAPAGVFVESQLGELLRPDLEALATVLEKQVGAPVRSINEGRALMNLPPLEGEIYDSIILNPGTPGTGAGGDGEDDDDGAAAADRTPEELNELIDSAATLIRSGFTAAAALDAVGLDPIDHTGLLPVTLKDAD